MRMFRSIAVLALACLALAQPAQAMTKLYTECIVSTNCPDIRYTGETISAADPDILYIGDTGRGASVGIVFSCETNNISNNPWLSKEYKYVNYYVAGKGLYGSGTTNYYVSSLPLRLNGTDTGTPLPFPPQYQRIVQGDTTNRWAYPYFVSRNWDVDGWELESSDLDNGLDAYLKKKGLDTNDLMSVSVGGGKYFYPTPAYQTYHIDYECTLCYTNTFGAESFSQTVTNKATVATNTFSRTGYAFKCWKKTGSAEEYNPGDPLSDLKNDVVFTAQWTANTYTVKLDQQGGTGDTAEVTAIFGAAMPSLTKPTRTGYTFGGYFTENGVQYYNASGSSEKSWDIASNTTLYAHWTPNSYVITFNANGGSPTTTSYTKEYGAELAAPAVSREGYTFAGWSPSVPLTVPASNATYVAQWTINSYAIAFDANDGSVATTNLLNYGAELAAPTVSREGYTFSRWLPSVPSTVPANDATYTAQWTTNQYKIAFDANGGSGSQNKWLYYGVPLSAPEVSWVGHTFTGWDPAVPSTVPAGDATYTAQWQVNTYAIVFDANDGSVATTNLLNYGAELAAPTVSREGYTFSRWLPSVPSKVPANDATYTAQWTTNQYKIVFDANGGSGGQNKWLYYGEPLSVPEVSWVGHTFTGWSPEVPAAVPASNATYKAQWTTGQYTLTFDTNGGEPGAIITNMDYGVELVAPTVSREGYTFADWSPSLPTTVPASNATYKAIWTTNRYTLTFDANGGEPSSIVTNMYYGAELVAPTNFIKSDHILYGWSPSVPETVPASNATYTAQWIPCFPVTFFDISDTETNVVDVVFYTNGFAYASLPMPETREGYDFAGWWTSTEPTNRVQQLTTDIATNSIKELYARWKELAQNIAVTTVVENVVKEHQVPWGAVVGSIAKPTSSDSGKSFAWWCCDGKPVQDDFIVTNSMTLTPQFTIKEFSDIVRIPELAFDTDTAKSKYGGADWYVDGTTLHSGAMPGNGTDDYYPMSRLIAYLKSPGSISFDYEASLYRESGDDPAYFSFYMDGRHRSAYTNIYSRTSGYIEEKGTGVIPAMSNAYWLVESTPYNGQDNYAILSNIKYQPEMPDWTNEWSSADSPSLKLVTASESGVLTFKYRVSGETGYVATNGAPVLCDYLKFSELGVGEPLVLEGFMATNEFVEVAITNTAETAHTFVWRYVKDCDEDAGDDAAWVTDIVWTHITVASTIEYEYTRPGGTVEKKSLFVPNEWVEEYWPGVTDYMSVLTNASGKIGFGGASLPYWFDFVAGTDPTNSASVFAVTNFCISADGVVTIDWSPNLTNRNYTIFGKTNLLDAVWTSPTNSAHRFFRVEVSLPE